jgi:GDP-L-fucose synthase
MADKLPFRLQGRRVFVAGHRGMVGQAICRRLATEQCEILTVGRIQVDLRRQQQTEDWIARAKPDVVFVAAATVGGILANATRPAEFLYDNLAIEANVIEASRKAGVAKLLFLGSSCIYPRDTAQPLTETALLTGPLEPTNEWYAIAKIAGIKMAQAYRRQHGCDYISAMPTNLYGPGDNFDLRSSHVVPALIAKIHAAKIEGRGEVEIWGSGRPKREFLFVDDLADALVHLVKHYSDEPHVNVGTGRDVTIAELAKTVARVVGWQGRFRYDTSKPDGTLCKLLDVTKLTALGWRAKTPLEQGLAQAYGWYREALAKGALPGDQAEAGAA